MSESKTQELDLMNNTAWSVTLLFKAHKGLCSVPITQEAVKQTVHHNRWPLNVLQTHLKAR